MTIHSTKSWTVAFVLAVLACSGTLLSQKQKDKDFQTAFNVDKKSLGVRGSNPYFNLTPGYQLSYRHGKETDVVTVLNETKRIDGVDARIVEDLREANIDLLRRAVAKELPYGKVTVTAVKGGLEIADASGGDAITIANAAVIVSLDDGKGG